MFRSDLTKEGDKALQDLIAPLLREGIDLVECADRLRNNLVDESDEDRALFVLPAEDAADGQEHKLYLSEKDLFFWADPEGFEPRGWES